MRFVKITILASALALALTACGRQGDEFTDATPDMEGLALEISDAAAEGVTVQGLEVGQTTAGVGTVPEFLQAARNTVRGLNEMLRQALTPLVNLVSRDGRIAPGEARVYGPHDQNNATWKLTVRRVEVGKYAWKLEAKPIGSEDSAYLIVMAGAVQRGLEPHRGRGVVGLNLDNAVAVGVTKDAAGTIPFNGQGRLLAAYAHVERADRSAEAKSLAYALRGFTPDASLHDPLSAAFVGHKLLPSGATAVRLVAQVNIDSTATAAKELVALRVRWLPGVGGAGAIRAWGGDIPDGTWYRGFACWDAQEQEGFKTIQSCTMNATTGVPDCTPLAGYPVGDLANCRQGAREADVVVPEETDVTSTVPEAGGPTIDPLAVPTDVPTGDGM